MPLTGTVLKLSESAYYSSDHLLYHNHFAAMGTRLDMIFHDVKRENGQHVAEILSLEILRLERLMSRFQKDSPVWMINQLAGFKPVQVDQELFEILMQCKEFYDLTHGLFDISLGNVVDLIRQKEYESLAFNDMLDMSGMDNIILDLDRMTIQFRNKKLKIDLGGFGKGYALERIRKILNEHEIINAFISFGESSVLALGNHPHGSGWIAGINNQMIKGESLYSFDLRNESLSTSGFFTGQETNGVPEQILHPTRGFTDRRYQHISIKSSIATEAEILSTSLIAANDEERQKILLLFESCKAVGVLYDENGKANIDMLT